MTSFETTSSQSLKGLSVPRDCDCEVFSLRSARELRDLNGTGNCTRQRKLDLGYCTALFESRPLTDLEELTDLNVMGCTGITDWSFLVELKALKCLNISFIDTPDLLDSIGKLTQLRELDLSGCRFSTLAPLAGLTNLQWLKLESCFNLTDISVVALFRKLKSIDVGFCHSLRDISPLGYLKPSAIDTDPESFFSGGKLPKWFDRLTIWYETWQKIEKQPSPIPPGALKAGMKALNIVFPIRVSIGERLVLCATRDTLFVFGPNGQPTRTSVEEVSILETVATELQTRIGSQSHGTLSVSIADPFFLQLLRLFGALLKSIQEIEVALWPRDLSILSESLAGIDLPRLVARNLGSVEIFTGLYGTVIETVVLENCPVLQDVDGSNIAVNRVEISNCPRLRKPPTIVDESMTEAEVLYR